MSITREKFIERMGHEPIDDNLERCNCPCAGEVGHYCCGWDEEADLPEFVTGRCAKKRYAEPSPPPLI
jgi:hypothetical protein